MPKNNMPKIRVKSARILRPMAVAPCLVDEPILIVLNRRDLPFEGRTGRYYGMVVNGMISLLRTFEIFTGQSMSVMAGCQCRRQRYDYPFWYRC